MELAAIILSCVIAAALLGAGGAKLAGAAPMRADARRFGIPYSGYRLIGAAEAAGAVGLALAAFVPDLRWLGYAAGGGLLLLMAGAVVVHRRAGDPAAKASGAVVFAVLVAVNAVLWLTAPA